MREVFYGVISQGVTPHFFMMEKIQACAIFGQPDVEITKPLYNLTAVYVANALILQNCHIFYFASNGAFEELCRHMLNGIKEDHPEVEILQVFCSFTKKDGATTVPYFRREDYDDVLELPFTDSETALDDCLRAIIHGSSHVISYVEKRNKSAFARANRAAKKQKDKHVINLYDVMKSLS